MSVGGPGIDKDTLRVPDGQIMIAIILSACLMNDASVCRDHRIQLLPHVSQMQCMMTAQPQIARWSEEHPQWRVVRWKCRSGRQEEI